MVAPLQLVDASVEDALTGKAVPQSRTVQTRSLMVHWPLAWHVMLVFEAALSSKPAPQEKEHVSPKVVPVQLASIPTSVGGGPQLTGWQDSGAADVQVLEALHVYVALAPVYPSRQVASQVAPRWRWVALSRTQSCRPDVVEMGSVVGHVGTSMGGRGGVAPRR